MESPWSIFSKNTREMNVFIWASMIHSAGSALMWPLTTIFVHQQLGRSLAEAGFVITMQFLGGMIGQVAGGSFYYRWGVRNLLIGALGASAILQASLVVTAYSSWWGYVITMFAIGFASNISMPAMQSFIGFRWPERRDELFNSFYVANNIGVALGTAVSGVLADISFNLTFLMNATASAAFAVFFHFYMSNEVTSRRVVTTSSIRSKSDRSEAGSMTLPADREKGVLPHLSLATKLRSIHIYLFIGCGSMFIWLANSLWGSGVAPHLTDQGMEMKMYSWLWTINGIFIFAGQPLLSWLKRNWAVEATSQLTWSAALYGTAYMMVWIWPSYTGFIFAMIVATLGEMLVSPAVPAFLSKVAGREAPFYLGLVGGISSLGRMIGPLALGIAYDAGGLNMVVIVSIIVAGLSLSSYMVHAWIQRGRQVQEPSSITCDR
ncbi:MFS transporter [Paenibacillus sp. SC116]|uniref:MFS transporter n=1 Tax=Paenibacillus sp. SC116 TaxID=2968986 RepID=UPI00215B25F7|nr:MFS transporter [Paenibacillus sp. SC116]MCR8844182.1 MFS transporter [Paenibacillus sp. SC116]